MSLDKRTIAGIGLGACAGLCLLLLAREIMGESWTGESRNPNAGHPTASHNAKSHSAPGHLWDIGEDQYYQGLKANRPDLSEAELRAKADHWYKVKTGQADVSGG